MTYSCADFVADTTELLKKAGYTLHERIDEDGDTVYWFCWSDGKVDIESGDDCYDELHCTFSAIHHWFANTRILTCEDESLLERGQWALEDADYAAAMRETGSA